MICAVALAPSSVARADDWFGRDKAWHAGLSAGLAGAGYGGTALFSQSRTLRLTVGGAGAVAAGAGKELFDLAGYGDPSWRDFTFDLIGTATGLGIAWLIDVLMSDSPPSPASRTHARACDSRSGLMPCGAAVPYALAIPSCKEKP